ncbi:hypothetical protein CCICO_02315 [Corynebacterium ciconiae DSM 44920]|uniref:DUF2334 domain-containing protein n=1 Tax=Corynebacterium ciconiae TaxID=227319 RepID=UPI0003720095|nr:DUF2334 domain-containing protein [Corynebacterium ciconiae]WKD60514.1 hypothetical protein CCICO_02315 [Corynebacterium ciconiae DSM 44920]
MHPTLLVSLSSVCARTLDDAAGFIEQCQHRDLPVSILVAPRVEGWRLKRDRSTQQWLQHCVTQGHCLVLNGFDASVQGRRTEFATLPAHEARLRLRGALRLMGDAGFELDLFAPPRWRMSAGTLAVLPELGFRGGASTKRIYNFGTGGFIRTRNLSVGEGYGTASWWRSSITQAARRGAARGNTIRLSISARSLATTGAQRDFFHAIDAATGYGADLHTYRSILHRRGA